jgi:hypothetical protein
MAFPVLKIRSPRQLISYGVELKAYIDDAVDTIPKGDTGPAGPKGDTGTDTAATKKTELQAIVASIATIEELKTQIAAWTPKV